MGERTARTIRLLSRLWQESLHQSALQGLALKTHTHKNIMAQKLTPSELRQFVTICERHDVSKKATFARLGKRLAQEIADEMQLPASTYDIRYNKAGPAVMGDLRLHSEHLYLTFEPSITGAGFMYRTCKGRKDYTGGTNQWADHKEFLDPAAFAQKLVKFLERYATRV